MLKKKLILAIILIIFLIGFVWLYNRSFIEITVQGSGNVSYQLLNQEGGQIQDFTTNKSRVKKLVKRGSYELLAENDQGSFIKVIKTGGFLKTTSVNVTLSPEKAREFVGNNPAPCMHYLDNVLVSYGCGGLFNSLQLHVPASPKQPTVFQTPQTFNDGSVESIVKTQSGNHLILIKAPSHDETDAAPHTLYRLGKDLSLSRPVALGSLREGGSYQLVTYKDGFIAYNSTFNHLMYFSSTGQKLADITPGRPKNAQLVPYTLSVSDEAFIVAYGSSGRQAVDLGPDSRDDAPSEIIFRGSQGEKHLSFDKQYGFIHLCGTNKLCGLHNETLEVYDISGDTKKLLFKVSGVEYMDRVGEQIILVRDDFLIGFDVDKRVGSAQYSFGEYEFCGFEAGGNEYLLCLINTNSKKVALRISPSKDNDGSIDKKVLELLDLPEVKDVSAYKNILYISPDLGDIKYVPELQGFGYDPAIKKQVNNTISQKINQLGINRQAYQIINTLD